MDKIKLTISPYARIWKPNMTNEWFVLSQHTQAFDFTINKTADLIGNQGKSFSHAAFRGTGEIRTENFISSQMLVLDFDGKDNPFSPQQVLDRLDGNGLKPNIIYRTFSDKTKDDLSKEQKLNQAKRFRVIFILNEIIKDINFYDKILRRGGYLLFPEADHAPHKVQTWAGGQEVIYLNTSARTSSHNLMCAADVFDASHITTSAGRKKRFKKKYEKLSPNIFHNANERVKAGVLKNANCLSIYKEIEKNETIRGFDWAAAQREFKLLDDFLGCKKKIYNPELIGLYSGMRRIEGGSLKWKKAIENNDKIKKYHLGIKDWFNTQFAKGKNPWEKLIENYAPNDLAGDEYDRLTDIHFKRGRKAIKLKNIQEITIEEAHMKMQTFIKKFLDSSDIKFAVCKAATALGKTIFILENVSTGCLICVPTHILAIQHAADLNKLKIDYLIAPDVPDLPEPIKKELDKYRSAGDNIGAARFLKRMSRNFKSYNFGLSGKEICELQQSLTQYFDELKKCTESTLPIIITHKRLLFTEFPNHDTVIIDEDIIPALQEMGSFSTEDLRQLINSLRRSDYTGHEKDLAVLNGLLDDINTNPQYLRHVQTTSGGRTEVFENFQEIRQCIHRLGNNVEGQILPFFTSSHYIVDFKNKNDPEGDRNIHYLIKHQLPSNKKFLVLSATANAFVYRKIFGEINWLDLSHIQHFGNRIQFSDLSHSRSTIASQNNKKPRNMIKNFIGSMPVLTFKKYRYLFNNNPTDIYVENCSGYNEYTGQDIAVIATPHMPTHVYRLLSAALEIEFTAEDFNLEPQWVKHNGYKFRFMTFAHEGLRNIQFYFIESALVQACGRNRSLRKDATVYLFSNFPLAGFEQHSTKELEQIGNHTIFNLNDSHETNIVTIGQVSGSMAS